MNEQDKLMYCGISDINYKVKLYFIKVIYFRNILHFFYICDTNELQNTKFTLYQSIIIQQLKLFMMIWITLVI